MIATTADFTGLYKISQTIYSQLQAYIDTHEPMYLKRLFGCELYDLYLASPLDARFVAVTDPFCFQEDGCENEMYISEGLKTMLLGFIYFEFVNDQSTQNRTTGNVKVESENSVRSDNQINTTIDMYNRGVKNFTAIQKKMSLDDVTYPEFKGLPLREIIMGGIL